MKKFIPRPYQEAIIEHIIRTPRCAVWAGMGTGKTVSTLTALSYLLDFEDAGPALVIAPLRVAMSTWPDETRSFKHLTHIKLVCLSGLKDKKARESALETPADVYVCNFEQIEWLVEKFGRGWPFKTVVVDESTRLKGFRRHSGTKRARALGRVAHLYCERFIELTGTPSPNGLLDLWGQAWFLDHGKRLGESMRAYEERWFRPRRVGSEAYMVAWDPMPGSDKAIKDALSDLTITVNAEDWFDIKKPIESNVTVTLDAKVMEQYRTLEREFYLQLENGEIEAANAAAKLGKLLQFASGAVYSSDVVRPNEWMQVHNAKIEALRSVVEEAAGAPILVAYQFKHELARILEAFPQARELDKNPQTIRDWNDGKIPMLVAHPASCGHGLNLQDGGNILCFFGLGFNYEYFAQIIERIGPTRQAQSGHPRPVFVYYIVAKGTADMTVLAALRRKEKVMDFILGRIADGTQATADA